jgi:hypothetical protein
VVVGELSSVQVEEPDVALLALALCRTPCQRRPHQGMIAAGVTGRVPQVIHLLGMELR